MTAPAPLPPVPAPGPDAVQLAATIAGDGVGELVVAGTDLATAWLLAQRAGTDAAQATRHDSTPARIVDDVLDRLPGLAGGHAEGHDVLVPADLAVGFARALREGHTARVDAVCAEQGWAGPPVLLVEAATALRGTAQVIVRSDSPAPVHFASLLHLPSGWVLIERTPDAVVHRPAAREDLAALLVSAVTAHADAVRDRQEVADDE